MLQPLRGVLGVEPLKLPAKLLDLSPCRSDYGSKYPIVAVQPANEAAEQLKASFIQDGWSKPSLHLQVGDREDSVFDNFTHEVSIITYAVLAEWVSRVYYTSESPILRYSGFFLDDFYDLGPAVERAVRGLGRLLQEKGCGTPCESLLRVMEYYQLM